MKSTLELACIKKVRQLIEQDPYLKGGSKYSAHPHLEIANGRCVFTLKTLFEWVNTGVDMDCQIDYQAFRSELYKSTLNQTLMALGYKIEVQQSSGHVDSSIYRLVRC